MKTFIKLCLAALLFICTAGNEVKSRTSDKTFNVEWNADIEKSIIESAAVSTNNQTDIAISKSSFECEAVSTTDQIDVAILKSNIELIQNETCHPVAKITPACINTIQAKNLQHCSWTLAFERPDNLYAIRLYQKLGKYSHKRYIEPIG